MTRSKLVWIIALHSILAATLPMRGAEPGSYPTADFQTPRFQTGDAQIGNYQAEDFRFGDVAFASNGTSTGGHEQIYEPVPSCESRWKHRSGVFADFLFLSARDISVPYAESLVTVTAAPPVFVSGGRVGEVEPGYQSGVRGGFVYALDDESSVAAAYSWYRSNGNDVLVAAPLAAPPVAGDVVLAPLGIQPDIPPMPFDIFGEFSTQATASQSVRFDLVDLDYRWLWASTPRAAVNGIAGVRYGRLEQGFQSSLIGFLNNYDVNSNVSIDGIGIRLGCDAEQAIGQYGLSIYGQAVGSLLAGEVDGQYQFIRSAAGVPNRDARVTINEHRVIPVVDLELGIAWTCNNERLRIKAGYTYSSWFNVAGVEDMIEAAQTRRFNDIESTISFDGLAAGVEYRR